MENVPQVHSAKNKPDFDKWLAFLDSKGYSNFWQDLGAQDYGVPQHRNRTFCLSILGDYTYKFPSAIPLEKCAMDLLDNEVGEKFYLCSERAQTLLENLDEDTLKNA